MLRSLLIALSSSRKLRGFAEQSPIGRRMAARFVAGISIEEAVAVAARINQQGMAVSLDALGEGITNEAEARRAASVYHRLLDTISNRGLNANVSLKLTQMGLDLSTELAYDIVDGLVHQAASLNNFIRVDMESAQYTDRTLQITERIHAKYPGHVGTVLQAYLHRTEADAVRLLQSHIRIRLCKGAYKEPASVAYPRKKDVDENYVRLMQRLLHSGVFCGIATHDEVIIAKTIGYAKEQGMDPSQFEFQMLYGIRRDLQRRLVRDGFKVRVYIPFGTAWYPYFIRRLAERPANMLFLARNLLRH